MGLVIMKLIKSGTGCRGLTPARAPYPIVVVRTWCSVVLSVFISLRVFILLSDFLLSDFLLTGLRFFAWILKSFWVCVHFNIYTVRWFLIILHWPFLLTCPAVSSSVGLRSQLPELDHFQFPGHHRLERRLCSTLVQLLNGFWKMYNINVSYRTSCSWITWHICTCHKQTMYDMKRNKLFEDRSPNRSKPFPEPSPNVPTIYYINIL